MTGRRSPAAAMVLVEAIRSGAWDQYLPALWLAIRQRQQHLAQQRVRAERLNRR